MFTNDEVIDVYVDFKQFVIAADSYAATNIL